MSLFNVWRHGAAMKTTVIAGNCQQAVDRFCQRHGYADHAEYCRQRRLAQTDIHVQAVYAPCQARGGCFAGDCCLR
ncbi:Uncharacterised protein [Bordetella ansorpii]|uniref:Uncharacterized protein n=1 Tax=Bordetella ansorpii TaxID=288768 RepID=A0A157SRU5_9BORD|nr:hypothetical protein [Bordetella ansorpii]SAI73139.1 Uncharacterised protein [Bordetella ansorpii]